MNELSEGIIIQVKRFKHSNIFVLLQSLCV
jgi:hypothetical protein